MAKKKTDGVAMEILEVSKGEIRFLIVGDSPLICHAMSDKAKHELLLPAKKKTKTQKETTLKHNPIEEYRDSIYRVRDDQPTLLAMPATCFKNALRCAGVDMEGATKAQLGRMTYVEGDMIPIYGVPEMLISVVRQAGMNRAPDIRTRAILPNWACVIDLTYVKPMLNDTIVLRLMAAAGVFQGIGDWRVEKGSGGYGRFSLRSEGDKDFAEIVKSGSREAQIKAMENPRFYDIETEEMFSWFNDELKQRGFERS